LPTQPTIHEQVVVHLKKSRKHLNSSDLNAEENCGGIEKRILK
jgi:hypothetical protein